MTQKSTGIRRFCEKQLDLLNEPFLINNQKLSVTASLGVSIFGEDADSPSDMIRNADIAMYQAKSNRNNYSVYTAGLKNIISENMEIESRLREAIDNELIDVFFQPQVDMSSSKVYGVESLARWNDKMLGVISPEKFFKVAGDTGLIGALGKLVISKAILYFREVQTFNTELQLSINFSADQLFDADLICFLKNTVELNGLSASLVTIEITEEVIISDTHEAAAVIRELKRLGFKISLDDFGTGYSSLSHLKDFDIDELKIDKSFIGKDKRLEDSADLIAAIVNMCDILNISCVVEGVEELHQLSILSQFGCVNYQGFYFYQPMSIDAFKKEFQSSFIFKRIETVVQ